MANPDNAHGFKYEYSNAGAAAALARIRAASNTSIAEGDALIVNADGRATIALATSAAILGVAAHPITGVATVAPWLLYYPAVETSVFSGQCSGDGEQTDVGESVDIEGGTGAMELDENASSTSVARVIGLKPGSAFGTNAELLFTWNKSAYTGQA